MIDTVRKTLDLLGPGERWRLAGLLAAMIVTGLLQTAGIASIMPFLAVVSNPSVVTTNSYLAGAYETLGFQTTRAFLVSLGALFVVVMVASNVFSAITTWATIRIQWRYHELISHRLLERYLRAPYAFHLTHNSARLGSTLLTQVKRFVSGVFLPCTQILARGIPAALIVVLLVAVDPLLALVVSVTIGGFYATAYSLVRRKQKSLGREELLAKAERYQVADEAFGGIKEFKVLGREEYLLDRFRGPSTRYVRAHSANAMVGQMPRFALESLAYGGIVVVVLYLLQTRETLDQVFPLLAVYALGANRLMPAVQEMFGALTQIRFGSAVLDELHADLYGAEAELHSEARSLASSGHVTASPGSDLRRGGIHFRNVTFQYPGSERPALESVDIEIPLNRTTAFVGATGSGKTTLVDLLLGLFEPSEGEILVGGVALLPGNLRAWQQSVGYVPQSIYLCDASVAANIAFGLPDALIDGDAVAVAAEAAHLVPFVSGLPNGYDTVVGERGVRLSGGERQRIGIARALYHRPQVLIFDEATSALDNVTEEIVMQAIRELSVNRTIVLIAHRLKTVRHCDLIYLMDQGAVVGSGSYEDLVASSPTFRAMAGVGSSGAVVGGFAPPFRP